MKRILIIHSAYTGHGHKSISTSLVEQFEAYDDVEVEVIDGFALIGRAGVEASKVYGPMTRKAVDLWKVTYTLSNQSSKALELMITSLIHDRLMKKLTSFTPDLIVTVHSLFVGSVLNLLEHYQMKIPFVTLQADLINIHSTWCDPRATYTFCPTEEAMESSLEHGMPREKLIVTGFPTRRRFTDAARTHNRADYTGDRPLECLLMSGGEGSGSMLRYAEMILKYVRVNLRIVCGRNVRLKQMLEDELLDEFQDRVEIYGFVDEIEKLMAESDLVIARGSPNTLMEAVVMNVPILITGSLPGQEEDNPALMVSHNLGVVCETPEATPAVIMTLIHENGRRLREIRAAQREYRDLDIAKDMVKGLYEITQPLERASFRYRQKIAVPAHINYANRRNQKPLPRPGQRVRS